MRSFNWTRGNTRQPSNIEGRKSLVFDVENTFIKRVEIMSFTQLEMLRQQPGFKENFILVTLPERIDCCNKSGDSCFCHMSLFQVRPYTYEFLHAVNRYYELVCFSKLPSDVISDICRQMEEHLNLPFLQRN